MSVWKVVYYFSTVIMHKQEQHVLSLLEPSCSTARFFFSGFMVRFPPSGNNMFCLYDSLMSVNVTLKEVSSNNEQ